MNALKPTAALLTTLMGFSVSFHATAQDAPVIGGVVFQSDTFMQTLQDGLQAAADERGATLILGNSETDLTKETSILDNLMVRGVDSLIISPFSADGSVAAVSRVVKDEIPVVCINTCLNEEAREGIISFIATRDVDLGTKTGEAAAAFIATELDGKAKIGILNCDTFPEACVPRKEGFLQALSAAGIDVEVVSDQTGYIADQALPIAEAMLQANPQINLLWAANEGGTTAHVLAVQSTGLAGEVYVFGTDMSAQHAQFLQADNDILQAVTGQAPYQIGYDAMMLTLDALEGTEPSMNGIVPTILFSRGDADAIEEFVETEGRALFAQ